MIRATAMSYTGFAIASPSRCDEPMSPPQTHFQIPTQKLYESAGMWFAPPSTPADDPGKRSAFSIADMIFDATSLASNERLDLDLGFDLRTMG